MVATVEKDAKTGDEAEDKGASLKVGREAYSLITKIARLRDKSIANLFREEDVEEFFAHLYSEELRKETENMKKKKKK